MSANGECPFCGIVVGQDPNVREVGRNRAVVTFFPDDPAAVGHCMVIPRRHVERFDKLTDSEIREVMLAVKRIMPSVLSLSNVEGINIIQSNGAVAGQTVEHVHVHILPRTDDDGIGDFWPRGREFTSEEIDSALRALNHGPLNLEGGESDADLRQHLQFLQDVISRMAQSSSNAKSWLLPVVTTAYGFALTRDEFSVACLGVVATLVFWFLDAGYLYNERRFRRLYDRVSDGDPVVPTFSLDSRLLKQSFWSRTCEMIRAATAWSIGPFYAALGVVGVFSLVQLA